MTSMRRNDVASTSFRRHVPNRFLINQYHIITFLILKYDIIENSRIELRGIVLPVQVGGLLGGGGQRVCCPPSQIIGGGCPPPPPPPSSYAYEGKYLGGREKFRVHHAQRPHACKIKNLNQNHYYNCLPYSPAQCQFI